MSCHGDPVDLIPRFAGKGGRLGVSSCNDGVMTIRHVPSVTQLGASMHL